MKDRRRELLRLGYLAAETGHCGLNTDTHQKSQDANHLNTVWLDIIPVLLSHHTHSSCSVIMASSHPIWLLTS